MPERLSARAQEIHNVQTSPAISELVELEFFSALSLRLRLGELERTHAERVASLFLSHVDGGLYTRIHLHAGHYLAARGYIARFDLPLRSPDALHLAVAAGENLELVTADQQLARNARGLGLNVSLVSSS